MVVNGSTAALADISGRVWIFAGREFDESRLELRVNGKPVELELKPLEILLQLLQHAGEVVTKDDLLNSVWPGLTVVDGSLSTAVYKLRKALGDNDSTIVVNVPRVGYRLVAQVQVSTVRPPAGTAGVTFEAGSPVPGRPHWRLVRSLDSSTNSEVWLAEHPKTREFRVFKFVIHLSRLKALKREVTVFRFLHESLGDRPEFVRVFEWNFDTPPYFLESEYGGSNLAQWAESQGGLTQIALERRLQWLVEIAKAVSVAHTAGVLHKDLKPANVLITRESNGEEQIKIADFGSASLIDPARLKALGITSLGMTQSGLPVSPSLTGTLMYLAPEVLAGNSPTALSDVYALGVILYQLVVGDFRKPLSLGWESEVEDPLLKEDIAAAASGDPARRLGSAAALIERLSHLDQRRADRNHVEQMHAQDKVQPTRRRRRGWLVLPAIVVIAIAAFLVFQRGIAPRAPAPLRVAVLPFQNAGPDHDLDFLRLALADEIASTLTYKRSLAVLPFATTSKYAEPDLDLQKAAREMRATTIVTGHFLKQGDQLQLTVEAVDVANNRLLWRDTFDAPTGDMIAMQRAIIETTREGLAPALGVSSFTPDTASRPQNEDAYSLYLHSVALPGDPVPNNQAIALLEESVLLDPNYAPAWQALALRYYYHAHYSGGGTAAIVRSEAAAERAHALDPNFVLADTMLLTLRMERSELAKAYAEAADLVRRRNDSADAHFALSAILRFAGLLDDAATECENARSLDPHNRAWRSCYVVFLMRGDYDRALQYIHLDDPGSEYARAQMLQVLLYQGRLKEAAQIPPGQTSWWASFRMLQACAAHKPEEEIAALARLVHGDEDPETNFWYSAHLAYCGQTEASLVLLKRAIDGNYCSYPAMDKGPFFTNMRDKPEFAALHAAGMACQQRFLAERQNPQHSQ